MPTSITTWDKKLPYSFTKKDWEAIFLMPFSITRDTKIRWFQYRIIDRILGTGAYLFKINYAESSTCTYSKKYPETIEHLFWTYRYSQAHVRNYLMSQNNIFGNLTLKEILFVYINCSKKTKNLLPIIFKMYIFNCRNKKNYHQFRA